VIRFGLELDLLDGTLAVADLPSAWHERYQENLGLQAPNDSDGVLQDVHWYGGLIGGAFQGYTLGNILAAQYFDAAVAAHPEIPALAANGEFETLHRWLRDNIYRHGRKYSTTELTQRVTGQPLQLDSYLSYLKEKYGAIYGL
ncbi:MAG: carboxypeptidase M32, partial [Caldilineaceae bacterium]|nr:carboxypeptidase M32 [Caldilineaceae bacterium]